jgi:hypothetical protein
MATAEGYFEMLRRVSVLVLPRGHLGSIGSGILVATASGRPCVLTARHVVDGVTDFKARLSGQYFGKIDDAVDAFVLGPERTGWGADLNTRDVDVALLSLRKRDHARIAEAIGNAHHDVTIADTPQGPREGSDRHHWVPGGGPSSPSPGRTMEENPQATVTLVTDFLAK